MQTIVMIPRSGRLWMGLWVLVIVAGHAGYFGGWLLLRLSLWSLPLLALAALCLMVAAGCVVELDQIGIEEGPDETDAEPDPADEMTFEEEVELKCRVMSEK